MARSVCGWKGRGRSRVRDKFPVGSKWCNLLGERGMVELDIIKLDLHNFGLGRMGGRGETEAASI